MASIAVRVFLFVVPPCFSRGIGQQQGALLQHLRIASVLRMKSKR